MSVCSLMFISFILCKIVTQYLMSRDVKHCDHTSACVARVYFLTLLCMALFMTVFVVRKLYLMLILFAKVLCKKLMLLLRIYLCYSFMCV